MLAIELGDCIVNVGSSVVKKCFRLMGMLLMEAILVGSRWKLYGFNFAVDLKLL